MTNSSTRAAVSGSGKGRSKPWPSDTVRKASKQTRPSSGASCALGLDNSMSFMAIAGSEKEKWRQGSLTAATGKPRPQPGSNDAEQPAEVGFDARGQRGQRLAEKFRREGIDGPQVRRVVERLARGRVFERVDSRRRFVG